MPADAVGRRELERYGPVGRAIAAARPMATLPAEGDLDQPIELFAMGSAGFFGAVAPVTAAIREVLGSEPSDLSVADASGSLETARAATSDQRLPAVRPGSPGESRRGAAAAADGEGEPERTLKEIDGVLCEPVVLPDGVVFALRQELLDN